MPIPQTRAVTATVTVAANLFDAALPKVLSTRSAVAPVSFRCAMRCCV
jgi:hypothetical protein